MSKARTRVRIYIYKCLFSSVRLNINRGDIDQYWRVDVLIVRHRPRDAFNRRLDLSIKRPPILGQSVDFHVCPLSRITKYPHPPAYKVNTVF